MITNKRFRFLQHRSHAKRRDILFLFKFEDWERKWDESGKWELRGRGIGEYCMSRYGDVGPYSWDNTFIQLSSDNSKQGMAGNTNACRIMLQEEKDMRSKLIKQAYKDKPLPKVSCPHCNKIGAGGSMKRWHFDNCKENIT